MRSSDQGLERLFNEKNRCRVEFNDRINERALKEIWELIGVLPTTCRMKIAPGSSWSVPMTRGERRA